MNLTLLLDMAVEGFGDRILVGRQADGLTAAELRNHAVAGAGLVTAAGADSVLYLGVGGPGFPVALFSAAAAGVPLVPLNYRLGPDQLTAMLANHPKALVVADEGHHVLLRSAGLEPRTPADLLGETAEAPKPKEVPFVDPESAAVIIYTSGTTSAPKGVILRHQNLVSYVIGTVEFGSAGAEDAAVMSVPPYHIAGVSNTLSNLYAGRRVVALDAFTPAGWIEVVRDEQITNAMVVPTMLARIMDEPALDRAVPHLRSLSYGGAAMPRRVIEKALREWPHVDFVNAYGLTETSSTISILGPDDHRAALTSEDPDVRARLSSAGRAVPGVEIEIRSEDGRPAAPGTSGQIWVRAAQVSTEYAGTGSSLDADGWFYTRDQGRLDAEAYLFIEGRADDTIIRGGENIAPAEIEDVLLRHPDVTDAVVVGIPDEEWGQRIEAVVVPRPGLELTSPILDELRRTVRGTLRASKTPDRFHAWPELPRTPLGKIIRREIVEALDI